MHQNTNKPLAQLQGIHMTRQGEYLSSYELTYDCGHRSKTYEIASRCGSRHFRQPPLTAETLAATPIGVALFVYDRDHTHILMGKEFRLGINKYLFNNISGLIDCGESPEQAAARELFEETGLHLATILHILPPSFPSAPISDDSVYCIICEAEGSIRENQSAVEEIHASWYSKKKTRQLLQGSIPFSSRMQAMAWFWCQS